MNTMNLFVYLYLILLVFAESNNIFSMEEKEGSYDIGSRYYEGIGVEVDKVEAAKWFRRATEEKHVKAQYRLAVCYDLGDGVDQDKAEAFKLFQEAAKQQHIVAQFRTGVCYEKGDGVKQDKVKALQWFQKAANQGNAPAKQRVIKLESELFGHTTATDQLNSSDNINSTINKNHENSPHRKLICGHAIKNTNSIAPQKPITSHRKKNQNQNDQKTLTPEELIKAEEAARKAMDELLAEEEAELKKKKRPVRNRRTQAKEKDKAEKNKKGKDELAQTPQKREMKKPGSDKPVEVSVKKIRAVKDPPPVMNSPQTQKQTKASKQKKKSQSSSTIQTTQSLNSSHTLTLPENHKRDQELTDIIGSVRESALLNQSDCLAIQEIKEQEKKTKLDEEENITGLPKLLDQTEQTVISLNSWAGTQESKRKATKDTSFLLNYGEENNNTLPERSESIAPETLSLNSFASTNISDKTTIVPETQLQHSSHIPPISDTTLKTYKEKRPKALWNNMKDKLRGKKPESQSKEKKNKDKKEIKQESNINSSTICQTVANQTSPISREPGKMQHRSGQIRYIQVPVHIPFPVTVPIYIPVTTAYPPRNSSNTPSLWVPHTQITYEGDKKIVAQWSDEGSGSLHIYHPNSEALEQENNQLAKQLDYLENLLKKNGYQIENQWNEADFSSSRTFHHGGDVANQKNEELKKKICYLEKFLQEKSIEIPK